MLVVIMTDSRRGSLAVMTIKPEGELTIQSAQDNKVLWLKALADADALVVDLSAIERIDVTGAPLITHDFARVFSKNHFLNKKYALILLIHPVSAYFSRFRTD